MPNEAWQRPAVGAGAPSRAQRPSSLLQLSGFCGLALYFGLQSRHPASSALGIFLSIADPLPRCPVCDKLLVPGAARGCLSHLTVSITYWLHHWDPSLSTGARSHFPQSGMRSWDMTPGWALENIESQSAEAVPFPGLRGSF